MPRRRKDEEEEGKKLAAGGFLTVDEAAEFLRVSRVTVYHLMQRRELPSAKFAGRRRIPWNGLLAYAGLQMRNQEKAMPWPGRPPRRKGGKGPAAGLQSPPAGDPAPADSSCPASPAEVPPNADTPRPPPRRGP
jgi:excisionase family DNA binding protein